MKGGIFILSKKEYMLRGGKFSCSIDIELYMEGVAYVN